MGRKCYIVNCESRSIKDLRTPIFRFPKDEQWRQDWLKMLPKRDVNLDHSGVCSLHFEPQFIKTMKGRHRLLNYAVPTIFPSGPFQDPIFMQDTIVDVEIDNEQSINHIENEIMHFDNLRYNLTEKLNIDNWLVVESSGNIFIFKINKEPNGNLSILSTINIDGDLVMKVFINNKSDEGIVPSNWKISQWSELQNIIDKIQIDIDSENDMNSSMDYGLDNLVVLKNEFNDKRFNKDIERSASDGKVSTNILLDTRI